jgi:hypothetical protein
MKMLVALRWMLIAGIAAVLAGCQGTGSPTPDGLHAEPAAPLAAAAPPELQPGASFVFRQSSGEEVGFRVVGVEGDDVTWQSDNGWTWTGKAFFWPVERWQRAGSGGWQEVRGDPEALFPLAVGERAAYRYAGRSVDEPAGWSGAGRCTVAETERVTVPAGTFDTFKIVCEQGEDLDDPYRIRTWWYAPAVGHHVATLHRTRDGRIDNLEQLVRYQTG